MGYSQAMTDPPKREGKVIHPRLPDDLHSAVVKFAEDTNRNGAVVQLLSEALAARGSGAKTPPHGSPTQT